MAGSFEPTSPVPDSPNSLRNVTATIDKLTTSLSNHSRSSSPEPPHVTTCCCGRDDCENARAWLAYKAKLEGRLVLSAGEFYMTSYSPRCAGGTTPTKLQAPVTKQPMPYLRSPTVRASPSTVFHWKGCRFVLHTDYVCRNWPGTS